ncbi:MAG: phosphodiester glycosidase family protein [Oscillospiraceae bacterium]
MEIKLVSSKSRRTPQARDKTEPKRRREPELKDIITPPISENGVKKKKRSLKKRLITFFCVIAFLVGSYFFLVYTNIPFIKNLRDAYIETAMSTMTHQWLAEWFFPQSVIDEVMSRMHEAEDKQVGIESKWKDDPIEKANNDFYAMFDELDKSALEAYLAEHPESKRASLLDLDINEAGINDDGTTLTTKQGDQVLAISGKHKLMLVRVKGSGYQGVLAILKDAKDLRCCPAQYLGSIGEVLESIVPRNNGVLGINGSGFSDWKGVGNGGKLKGYAMCSGVEYGKHFTDSRKRLELRDDNKIYIVDSKTETTPGTRDAVEFRPALIIDGVPLVDELSGFMSIQPRCVVGQSKDGDVLMLVIEGRLVGRSLGIGLPECTKIMQRYDAYQAMNMDGGTSAVMWYDGEYVTKCSNPAITCRYLPDAWIYGYAA